jgi:hypothetical protein
MKNDDDCLEWGKVSYESRIETRRERHEIK